MKRLGILFCMLVLPAGVSGQERISEEAALKFFETSVRPVLVSRCFPCHGPDHNTRMANLRLDARDEALARGVIVPGRPERSPLVARIFAKEPARVMPPVASHKRLTPAEKELLRRWIAQGAPYEPHWAFVPLPARVEVDSQLA